LEINGNSSIQIVWVVESTVLFVEGSVKLFIKIVKHYLIEFTSALRAIKSKDLEEISTIQMTRQ
jgi:hypothetical protein